ncbi:MAG: rhamnogalacturonan acetylesterase [Verrucomicrobia bacterium]|nr:rhamnogalacturonan acetylesterase [Verrucomicrobiota bacterium]
MNLRPIVAPAVFVRRSAARRNSPATFRLTAGLQTLGTAIAFLLSFAAAAQTPAPDLKKNPAPTIAPLNPALPTLFVAGDSTAARGRGERQQGWGVPLADYFDPAKANVANRARGGRSSRTFITEGSWDKLLAEMKAGDVVLIQFGHNDGSPVNEEPSVPVSARRARGTIGGLGDETREVDNIITKQHEVVHTYGWYMRKYIADTKAKGAFPIVVSCTVRNIWKDGRIERGPGKYREWSFDLAKAAAVPFIDLSTAMADKFDALGEEKTKAVYQQDHTHFDAVGADLHAAAVVAGLKGLRTKNVDPLLTALSAKGTAVAADKFTWLRLPVPRDRSLPSLFLAGDSTVRQGRGDGAEGGQWGWGDYISPFFDTDKINVVNRAVGGTGVRSFIAPGSHWENLLALVKPGDFVMIQFGHNDNGARGPLKGIGDEVEERAATKDSPAGTVRTWGWYMRRYIADVRAKGATPIVCSLIPRKRWENGKVVRDAATHAGWAAQVAAAEKVAFFDLNENIARRYEELGAEKVNAFFADERVHTSLAGAKLNAEIVVTTLRTLPTDPLAAYLR